MKVLFWGTPEFATAPLRALLGEGFEVCGVVSQPDKPVGRKREITPTPVKAIALQENLPVYQPESMKDPEFIEALEIMEPDISVVVAYGKILPKSLIDLPKLGTLNIHASLLPALRGAAPIQEAIRSGLSETGVSIMKMVPALDAGAVILTRTVPISSDETYGELQTRLSELGASALIEALALISIGEAVETPQDESLATYAPKVDRKTSKVDWTQPAQTVANLIRAYDPKPIAFTTLNGVDVKLFGPCVVEPGIDSRVDESAITKDSSSAKDSSPEHSESKQNPATAVTSNSRTLPGTVVSTDNQLVVACGDGAVAISQVQPAGKKRMNTRDWIMGRGINVGDTFE